MKDDKWIMEHADELKEELRELAKGGGPRPESHTLLGRALDIFAGEFIAEGEAEGFDFGDDGDNQ